MQEKIKNALYAAIVGDALGVPVESSTRQQLALCSVKNMLGYGRWDQPEGTWSDDSSLTLCTMESLARGYDIEDIGRTFCNWLFDGHWTSTGFVFDAGLTTFLALDKIRNDKMSALESGCGGEEDIGNGSLMRMLPVSVYFRDDPIDSFLKTIHDVSAITHAHPRAKLGCGIYSLLVRELMTAKDKTEALSAAIAKAMDFYQPLPEFSGELGHFSRILSADIAGLKPDQIRSTGYLVDTLEASIWCLLNYSNTKDVLLAAVNLGMDTDTTGLVAGGIAGLHYGLDGVPTGWINSLARKKDIDAMIETFTGCAVRRTTTL
jgi:ADP-ribosyl-[dinitrogen reductase] hydrolase